MRIVDQPQSESHGSSAMMGDDSPSMAHDVLDDGWHASVAGVLNELNEHACLYAIDGMNEEAVDGIDVCALYMCSKDRARLRQCVETAARLFPFPTLTSSASHDVSQHTPTVKDLLREIEHGIKRLTLDAGKDDAMTLDQIEILSRVLALRSGLCRIAAELSAFLVNRAEEVRIEREGGISPRRSHRNHLLDIRGNE